MKAYLYGWLGIISFSFCWVNGVALGQITPDGTVPTQVNSTRSSGTRTTVRITGGTQAGKNLFHSFNEFSVPTNTTAYFDNSITINNIISRVTGGTISQIDGLIKANGAANLFIINPMGFVFGPHARLDLGGSFIASSASSIKFTDGSEFGVNSPASSLLTVAVPMGLQFGQTPPGDITNHSQSLPLSSNKTPSGLKVQPDKTLALIGGNVTSDNGNLTALGGRIELGSVGENSYVSLTPIEKGWQAGYQQTQSFQDIFLTQKSILDASGNGGAVQIQGRRITLTEGTQIGLVALEEDTPTGDLIINGIESVEIIGQTTPIELGESTGIFIFTTSNSDNPGTTIINTAKFSLRDGAIINLETQGKGRGGSLIINASEFAEVKGTGFLASSLILSSAALSTVGGESLGDGGNIIINTKILNLADGGQIAANTVTSAKGGTITINATNQVEISGQGVSLDLEMDRFPSLISASSGDRVSEEIGTGDGGSIEINTERVIIRDEARITVESFKSGAAGTLSINARTIFLDQQAQINAAIIETITGSGGQINLVASDSIELRHNSSITAQAIDTQDGSPNGGNIDLKTPFIFAVPVENSDILANAGQGNGGNINITATGIFGLQVRQGEPINLSEINASSKTGISGVVTINRPDVDSQSNLATLPTQVVDTENLIVQGCRTGVETAGEFSIKGRGGLPVDPNQTVSSNQGIADLGNPVNSETPRSSVVSPVNKSETSAEPIIEAQGWLIDDRGQIVLTAQATTVTPQSYNKPTKCSGP